MGRRIAEASFLVVTNIVPDMILETAYIYENIESISPKKGTLKLTAASPIGIEESVESAVYMANSLESQQGHLANAFYKPRRTAVCKKIIRLMSEVYLNVRSNTQTGRLDRSHENLDKNHHTLVTQSKAAIVTTKYFIFKIANWSSK